MAYKIVNMWTPASKYHIKAPYSMKPVGITIHETDNNATARNEAAYMNRNNMYTSWHVAIDEKEVVQVIPFNRSAWHAGDGANGAGNRRHIGIEICRNKDNGFAGKPSQRLEDAYRNAAEYVAHVLIQYGWSTDVLRQHWHHSGKNCPRKIRLFNRWNWFKNLVQQNMDRINGVKKEEPKPAPAKPAPTPQTKPQPKPQPTPKPIEEPKAVQLEVALKDLKFKANQWRTEEVEAKGSFVVGGSSIMTRFGSPNLNSAEGGRAQSGYKVNFDLIALTEEHAWLRYSFDNRVKWIPFATRAGFEKDEYWGEFE